MAYYQSFSQLMYLIGKEVAVNRSKPGACLGKLISVQNDYLTIQRKDNSVVYYRLETIIHFSEFRRKRSPRGYKINIRVVLAYSFVQILCSFRRRILTIDHSGPEQHVGMVVNVTPSELTIVSDGKVVNLPLGKIRYVASSTS
ncbi:DUF2642 domain-containing protein [Paenibacillus pinihumi]|uniref:DUF2642 domain-containing protein n=1 Tax=Paenibacillus pinihumi TaxID=669462 RepID=UPI00048E2514|nr:DUF2642 domain-containing protein [Paenibacillus pinihumi]